MTTDLSPQVARTSLKHFAEPEDRQMTTNPYFNQDYLLTHISQTLPQFSTLKPEDADVSAEDGLR